MSSRVVKNNGQKHCSRLGAKLYFHVNSSRKNSIVLTPNMAALACGCEPRIASVVNGFAARTQTELSERQSRSHLATFVALS